jgi:putative spermidine/putrescine transport system ATP-binding protein
LENPEFILKVPNSTSNLELKVGQEIKIGWNSSDARALDPK